jgi:hypothetical protein
LRSQGGGGLIPESLSYRLVLGCLKAVCDRADLALHGREALVERRRSDRDAVRRPGEIDCLVARERQKVGTEASPRLPQVQGRDRVPDYLQHAADDDECRAHAPESDSVAACARKEDEMAPPMARGGKCSEARTIAFFLVALHRRAIASATQRR